MILKRLVGYAGDIWKYLLHAVLQFHADFSITLQGGILCNTTVLHLKCPISWFIFPMCFDRFNAHNIAYNSYEVKNIKWIMKLSALSNSLKQRRIMWWFGISALEKHLHHAMTYCVFIVKFNMHHFFVSLISILFYIIKISIIFTFMHLADAFIQSHLQLHSGYTFLISICVPWESNPQPFALLMQCSTTEPHRNKFIIAFFCFLFII